ncbi:MAG: YdcF family protein [Smithella sp.]
MKKRKKTSFIWLLIVLLIASAVIYAPRYLLYSTNYRKVDAIVLLLGPDFTARRKQAYQLIDEGKADYLIIPAYNKVSKISDKVTDRGSAKSLSPNLLMRDSGKKKIILDPYSYPGFYEDTHMEIIAAKKTMADFGLKSATFVSSPYHMRRIKLIASSEFKEEKMEFYFVPTIYEKAPANFWELSSAEWKKVGREYTKMIWFALYSRWIK